MDRVYNFSAGPSMLPLEALERAGATFEEEGASPARQPLTKADLYALGLTGRPDSAARRAALLEKLALPSRMSTNALLEALNILYSREELLEGEA